MARVRRPAVLRTCFAASALAALALSFGQGSSARADAGTTLRKAWEATEAVKSYEFDSRIEIQTLLPPAIRSVGKQAGLRQLRVAGRVDRNADRLTLQLWDDPEHFEDPGAATELALEDGQARARLAGGGWQELEALGAGSAPVGDAAAFLRAARNVRALGSDTRQMPLADGSLATLRFERYAFAIDGRSLASQLRDAAVERMRARGELPASLSLALDPRMAEMDARGEAWIDASGRPLRIQLSMEHPQAADGTRSIVEVTSDFSGYREAGSEAWGLFGRQSGSRFAGPWSAEGIGEPAQLASLALCLALLAAIGLWRRPRQAYRFFACFMAFQMAFSSPILALTQSQQIERFFERFPGARSAQAAEAPATASQLPFASLPPARPMPAVPAVLPGRDATGRAPAAPQAAPAAVAAQAIGGDDADEDGLTDAIETLWGTRPDDPDSDGDSISDYDETIRCPFPEPRLIAEREANAASPGCPSPTDRDTDGDRLLDGEEILHIGTLANQVDTDGDRISDYNEVKGFAFAGGREHSDPRKLDSDRDGLPDGVECPSMRDADAPGPTFQPSWSASLSCRDSQATGRPDILNLDNDGDGVPNREDLSPHAPQAGPFDAERPMALELAGLRPDLPVLVKVQLRPSEPRHLSLARKVLDWPTGDNQGQIQRLTDSTIASVFGPADPSDPAHEGDMRLTPMLQAHLPGDSQDLPRVPARAEVELSDAGRRMGRAVFSNRLNAEGEITSAQLRVEALAGKQAELVLAEGGCDEANDVFSSTVGPGQHLILPGLANLGAVANGQHVVRLKLGGIDYCSPVPDLIEGEEQVELSFEKREPSQIQRLGALELSQGPPGQSRLRFRFEDTGASYEADLLRGRCSEPGKPVAQLTDLADGADRSLAGDPVDWVDGEHSLLLRQGGASISCQSLGNIVSGRVGEVKQRRMIDAEALTDYQVSVHEDLDGRLLALVPLRLSSDAQTQAPVAFEAALPLLRSSRDTARLELRLVWLVSLLGDDDRMRIVHQMPEEPWSLTGLAVEEQLGHDLLVIHENPDADQLEQQDADPETRGHLEVEDDLWVLAAGLEDNFVGNRLDATGQRALTLDTIVERWSTRAAEHNDRERWGIATDGLRVHQLPFYASDAALGSLGSQDIPAILSAEFGEGKRSQPDLMGNDQTTLAPTLLVAMESRRRSLNLDRGVDAPELARVEGASVRLDLDPAQVPETVSASLSWKPYRYRQERWEDYPLELYWQRMKTVLGRLPDFAQTSDSGDQGRYEATADIFLAQVAYTRLLAGVSSVVQIGEATFSPNVEDTSDEELANIGEVSQLAKQEAGGRIFDAIGRWTEPFYEEYKDYRKINKLNSLVGLQKEPYSFRSALGRLLEQDANSGAWQSQLRAFEDATDGSWRQRMLDSVDASRVRTASLMSTALGIFVNAEIGPDGASVENVAGLTLQSVVTGDTSLELIRQYRAFQAFKAERPGAGLADFLRDTDTTKSARLAGVAGTVMSASISFGIFFAAVERKGIEPGGAVYNEELVAVVAELVIEAVMTALALNGAGAFVVAVVELFDALAGLACSATPMTEEERDEAWYCRGLKGLLGELLAFLIYDETELVALDDPSRLAVTRLNPLLDRPERGFVPDQTLTIAMTVRNQVRRNEPEGIGAQRPSQFSIDQVRQSAFDYAITPAEIDAPAPVLGTTAWEVVSDTLRMSRDLSTSLPGPTRAGINVPVRAYLAEGYAIQVQRCAGLALAACWLETRSDSRYMDLGLAYDLFPPRLSDFAALVPRGAEGGQALAWGEDSVPRFPILADADGDGLHYSIDPNDSKPDTDADDLPDGVEMARGSDPLRRDSDGDGLADGEEARFGSDPLRADSDSDGLTDAAERAGWELVYNRAGDRTWVFPDPWQSDADQDGISDGREQELGFSPWAANDGTVLSYVSQLREPTAPLLLMRMNETAGAVSTADGSQPGSLHAGGCSAPACPDTGFRAIQGNAARFDGLDDHYRIDPIPEISALTTNFFVGAWVMPARLEGRQQIFGHSRQLRSDGFGFGLADDGLFLNFHGRKDFLAPGLGIPADHWSYVFAFVRPDGEASGGPVSTEVFLGWTDLERKVGDGAELSAPIEGAMPDLDEALIIGAAQAESGDPDAAPLIEQAFAGRIDELVIVGAPLASEAEILPNMLGLYNLDDGVAAPGQALVHKTDLANRLLGKNVAGLLKVDLPAALLDEGSAYAHFNLGPAVAEADTPPEKQILHPLTVDPAAVSGDYRIRQDMAATIDRKTLPVGDLSQQAYRDAIMYDLDRIRLVVDKPWDPKWRPHSPDGSPYSDRIRYDGGDITIASWVDWTGYQWLGTGGSLGLRYGIMGYDAGRDRNGVLPYQTKTNRDMVKEAYPSLLVEDGHLIFGFGCEDGDNGWCEVRSTGKYVQKGEPVHVAVSFDRSANRARLYIDQRPVEDLDTAGMVPKPAVKFVVGTANEHDYVAAPTRSLCDLPPRTYPIFGSVDDEVLSPLSATVGLRGSVDLHTLRFREGISLFFSRRDQGGFRHFQINDLDENGDDPTSFLSSDRCASVDLALHPASTFSGQIWDLEVYGLALDDAQIQDVVESRSTIARFRFDEVPGQTRFADTVGGSHADCFDASCPVAGLRGRENLALGFDGVDDWVQVAKAGELLWSYLQTPEATGFSLGAWLQAGELTKTGTLLALRYPGTGRPSLDLRAVPDSRGLGEMRFWFGENDLAYAFPGDSFRRDEWHHVLVTVDAQNYRGSFYVDGKLRQSFDMGPLPGRAQLDLGMTEGGRFALAGRLDEVYIGKGHMEAAEVDALYRGVPTLSLPMDEDDPDLPTWSAQLVEGQINEARLFDTADDRLVLGDASAYQLYGGDFSLLAWVLTEEMEGLPGTPRPLPIVAPESGSTSIFLGLLDGKPLAFFSADGKTSQLQVERTIPPNQWTQLVFQRRADPEREGKARLEIFVNGSLAASAGGLEPVAVGPDRGLVSLGGNLNRYWRGRLDEISFYRRALDAEEIAGLFNTQNTWIDESSLAKLTVDGEPPSLRLPQSGDRLPLAPTVLAVEAEDAHSTTQLVVLVAESEAHPVRYAWGYPCPGSEDGALLCVEFDPPGEGRYDLTLYPVDRVGNFQELDGREGGGEAWHLYVDGSPPDLEIDPLPEDAFRPLPAADDPAGWVLRLSGRVRDPAIEDAPGSGVARIEALVRDINGLPLGEPPLQAALVQGETWHLDYRLRSDQPTGRYTGSLAAYDAVGNRTEMPLPEFQVDATDPQAVMLRITGKEGGPIPLGALRLDASEPTYLGATTVISGTVNERPENLEAQDRVAGVAGVQLALEPLLAEASTWVDLPLPPGVLLDLPFDEHDAVGDAGGLYTDLVAGRRARCIDPACPQSNLESRNGQALSFDGKDDSLALDADPTIASLTDDFTIAAWIKPERLEGVGRFISTPRSGNAGGFGFGHSGRRLLLSTWFVFDYRSSRDLLIPGVWQHVAAHMRPDHDVELYLNGILVETIKGDQPARRSSDDRLLIGAADQSGRPELDAPFAGAIDSLVIAAGRIEPAHWDAIFGLGPTLHLGFDERIVIQGSALADSGGMGARASYSAFDADDASNHSQLGAVGPAALSLNPASDGFRVAAPAGVLPRPNRSFSLMFWAEDLGLGELVYSENSIAFDGNALLIDLGDQRVTADPGDIRGWHHYAFVWDEPSQQLSVAVDGALLGSVVVETGSGLSQAATEMRFTHQSSNQRYGLDDLRVYQRALPAQELAALAAERWFEAMVEGLDGGPAGQARWTAGLPPGLEGFYALKLRGADRQGNVDLEPRAQWSGSLDTLAPRLLDGRYQPASDAITFTLRYADFNLDLDHLLLPGDCAASLQIEASRYRTPWYLALTGLLPSAAETSLARERVHEAEIVCRASYVVAGEPIQVCDRAGNCSRLNYPGESIGEPPPTPTAGPSPTTAGPSVTPDSTSSPGAGRYRTYLPMLLKGHPLDSTSSPGTGRNRTYLPMLLKGHPLERP